MWLSLFCNVADYKEDVMGRNIAGPNLGRRRKKKKINVAIVGEVTAWIVEIALVILVAFVFTYFFGVRASVAGSSMSAQLEDGDQVLVDRFLYRFMSPKSGDVIAFYPNGNRNSHYYMKRVIGIPGDTVQIKDGVVYLNGEEYEERVEVSRMDEAGLAEEEILLGEDEFFVLGDNRNNSEDSRFANIGNIKEDYIIGKAWWIISPRSKFGKIH